ncbi:MAG: YHS domain-containing (seleno)protein [Cyanobacteria bacterium J06635_1]
MYLLIPRISSALAATLGLCLMVSCASSTPVSSVDETAPQTAAVETETTPNASSPEDLAGIFAEDGIAIRGADPVAYFTESDYVPGSAEYTHEWGGATWQFASAENRDLFASNPEQYAPAYGGFCAWAVSQGYTAPIDPTAWKVVDGKLYLNYDAKVQKRWSKDIPGNIAKADGNWPGVLSN